MVCRENKGRSAIIGLQKALYEAGGRQFGSIHDAEFQSAIHERGHEFDGAPQLTTEEQIALWRGLRQHIEDDESIPHALKYRQSHKQPGLVTRIDQEIKRLETGMDENGRPLRNEQRNSGAQVAAIQRLGSMLGRVQPAKQAYFEIYARSTGGSVQQARAEWDSLMKEDRGGRGNVGISLRDDWKQRLAVSGLTTKMQADIGQSARARDALAVMERRRQAALDALESRPAIRDEHKTTFLHPNDPRRRVQCTGDGACGQFGHERSSCPNQDLVARRAELAQRRERADQLLKAAAINQQLANPDNAGLTYVDEGVVRHGGEARVMLTAERDRLAAGAHVPHPATVETQLRQMANEETDIDAQLSKRSPRVSQAVKELAYNPETGLLAVTTHPRRRVSDGKLTEPRTYLYRVSPAEYARLSSAQSVGAALNGTVWRRGKNGNNEGFRFENAADAEEALTQRRCPSCGRWASMNSSHVCPVPGGATHDADVENRARQAQWRQASRMAEENGDPPPPRPMPVRQRYGTLQARLPGGGVLSIPPKRQVIADANNGDVVRAVVVMKRPDATVSGTVTVWNDPSGQRLLSPLKEAGGQGLRCSCGRFGSEGTCNHIQGVARVLKDQWGAATVGTPQLRPGVTIEALRSPAALDAPKGELNRLSYEEIVNQRRAAERGEVRALRADRKAGRRLDTPRMVPPRDSDGTEVPWPTSWHRGDGSGKEVDLHDSIDVQQRLRQSLFSRSRKHWSVLREPDGAMRVTVPRARCAADGTVPSAERQELARLFNMPAPHVRRDGVYIPPDTSWRAEMLDRSYGDPPRIRAARFTL